MHILYLSHGKRGHAALAAAVTHKLQPTWIVLAAELGGNQSWLTPDEQAATLYASQNGWPLPLLQLPRADRTMIYNSDRVFYMEPQDVEILDRVMNKAEVLGMECLATYVQLPAIPWSVVASPEERYKTCELIVKAVQTMVATVGLNEAQIERRGMLESRR